MEHCYASLEFCTSHSVMYLHFLDQKVPLVQWITGVSMYLVRLFIETWICVFILNSDYSNITVLEWQYVILPFKS